MICGKTPVGANNVPNSMHKTRRMVKPNIQKIEGVKVCTRCIRTLKQKGLLPANA